MPTLDREPCSVEVPIGREKHIGFRFNKPGRGTLFVRPRDFSVWMTKDALSSSGLQQTHTLSVVIDVEAMRKMVRDELRRRR